MVSKTSEFKKWKKIVDSEEEDERFIGIDLDGTLLTSGTLTITSGKTIVSTRKKGGIWQVINNTI